MISKPSTKLKKNQLRLSPSELKKLRAKWYKKLKDTGFEDIETEKGLKRPSASGRMIQTVKDKRELNIRSAENYYRLAGWFLNEHKFECESDQYIWNMHSQGESYRTIEGLLKLKGYYPSSYGVVKQVIHRLREIMYEIYRVNYEQKRPSTN